MTNNRKCDIIVSEREGMKMNIIKKEILEFSEKETEAL